MSFRAGTANEPLALLVNDNGWRFHYADGLPGGASDHLTPGRFSHHYAKRVSSRQSELDQAHLCRWWINQLPPL
jgi:hypothetical protein